MARIQRRGDFLVNIDTPVPRSIRTHFGTQERIGERHATFTSPAGRGCFVFWISPPAGWKKAFTQFRTRAKNDCCIQRHDRSV